MKPVQSAAFLYLNMKPSVARTQKVLAAVLGNVCEWGSFQFSCYNPHLNYVDISGD